MSYVHKSDSLLWSSKIQMSSQKPMDHENRFCALTNPFKMELLSKECFQDPRKSPGQFYEHDLLLESGPLESKTIPQKQQCLQLLELIQHLQL